MIKEKFCEYCRKPLKNDGTCVCPKSTQNDVKGRGNENYSKLSKTWILAVIAVLIAVVGVGVLLASGTEKVELVQYLETDPDVNGLNSQGIIDIADLFDGSSFESDLIEGLKKIDSDELEDMSNDELELFFASSGEGFLECEQALKDIVVTVWEDGVEVQELTGLSNGDVIKVVAKSKNPTNKYLKKKFEIGKVEIVIEGLLDGKSIDIFKNTGLNVTYTGTNGNGQARLDYNADAMPDLHAEFILKEPAYNLSNGDAVEVMVNYDKDAWEAKGYYPLEFSRTYTVEGLKEYLKSPDEIPEEQLIQMKTDIENALLNEAANSWREEVSIEDMTYLGCYVLSKKEDSRGMGAPNLLYLVYKVDVFENFAPTGGDDNRFSYYYYGGYEGLILDMEGQIDLSGAYTTECWDTFTREVKTLTNVLEVWKSLTYTGYDTFDDLFRRCVENYSDEYTYLTDIQEN